MTSLNFRLPADLRAYRPAISTRLVSHPIFAAMLVGVVSGVLLLVRDLVTTPIIALLYLLPVLLSTTLWGLSGGITASILSFLSFDYFFIPPHYALIVHKPQDVIVLLVFLIVASVISQLVGQVKSSLASIQAREAEVIHLYDLSQSLSGLWDRSRIARMLAGKISEVFGRVQIEVRLYMPSGAIVIREPDGNPSDDMPLTILPLASTRGALGEVRVWSMREMSDAEIRLLRAMVAQGAWALERAALIESETRVTILEESDRLKSALLSSVSHELRTPLVTIRAAAESLHNGAVNRNSPAADDLLDALEEESDRLNRVVADLLNMSRLEAGALTLLRQWNVLAEIADTSIAGMRRAAQDHKLEVDVSEDLPLVPVDHVLMQQVFNNLISNSLKYAPTGTAVKVSAKLTKDGSAVLLEVSNEGPHVPAEHLEHIFDKFHRVTDAERIPGTGLGLSICRGIIEAHGGRIWAENQPGGFAFKFTLPLRWEGSAAPKLPIDSEII